MDTSYCEVQPKMQNDDARRKEMKEKDSGSGKGKLKHRQC
jgi:hypothetical protein